MIENFEKEIYDQISLGRVKFNELNQPFLQLITAREVLNSK